MSIPNPNAKRACKRAAIKGQARNKKSAIQIQILAEVIVIIHESNLFRKKNILRTDAKQKQCSVHAKFKLI